MRLSGPQPNPAVLRDIAEAMFAHDESARLVGEAPDLYVLRAFEGVVCRCHADLPEQLVARLVALAEGPRGKAGAWARDYADYVRVLSTFGPVETVRAGPLYAFAAEVRAPDGRAVRIDAGNVDLLRDGLDEWVSDIDGCQPMMAIVDGGRAVSLCASVKASASVHCAGVETIRGHRRRGMAVKAVTAWAHAVTAQGAMPFYGTTFDNMASQRIAARLGLKTVASEFWLRCKR